MAYGFSYHERADARKIAKALDFPAAEIVEVSKGKWQIKFGDTKTSHSKGVPATQLKAWIDGAMTVLGIADAKLEKAEKTRAETVAGLVPEGDDLIDALQRECEAQDADTTYMTQKLWCYMDASALSVDEIKSLADESGHDLAVLTEEEIEEDREATIERALQAHPLFQQAVRVAYPRNEAERREDIRELTHILAREWNAYNQGALLI